MGCKVRSIKDRVGSAKCKVQSVECPLYTVKCKDAKDIDAADVADGGPSEV